MKKDTIEHDKTNDKVFGVSHPAVRNIITILDSEMKTVQKDMF